MKTETGNTKQQSWEKKQNKTKKKRLARGNGREMHALIKSTIGQKKKKVKKKKGKEKKN